MYLRICPAFSITLTSAFPMWVLLDNYDSFTHILHHYLLQLHDDVRVFRNDELTVAELAALQPERIIISPGPRTPAHAGITMDVIGRFHQQIPILGICLGHQALGMFLGGKLVKAERPVHGSTTAVRHNGHRLFHTVPQTFDAMRYHSLLITEWEHTELLPLAFTAKNELMAFTHPAFPLTGIQFHPESVLTPAGESILRNWLKD
ncbi:MAG: aminodeoxychorismate/anthranilate synthase component II [Sphingobacteriales bacterium]|nr:MAG: aminodeoxychorismate/anthranilate synthase component II [Sphingobacteriales bacterium]